MESGALVKEVYKNLLAKFGYPRSEYLRKIVEVVFSESQAKLCLALPGTAEQVAGALKLENKTVESELDDMAVTGSIQRVRAPDGAYVYVPVYMPEVFCDSMMHSMAPDWDDDAHNLKTEKNRLIADLFHDWFENEWYRFERTDELIHKRVQMLGGANAPVMFTVTPAWKALEKSNADPPPQPEFDLRYIAKKAKDNGEKIYAAPCSCKVRARKAKVPMWTCGSMPGKNLIPASWKYHPAKIYKEWDPDEWLEMMGRCEEEFGLVHIGLPPVEYDVCTCDMECCNIFKPLKTHAHCYEGLDKSPYRSRVDEDKCEGRADCIKRCRFEAIKMIKHPDSGKLTALVDEEKCTGCGQCVIGCSLDAAIRLELA